MFTLGSTSSLREHSVLMLAGALVAAQAVVVNRQAGFPCTLWTLKPHLIEEYYNETKKGLLEEEGQEREFEKTYDD